MAKVNKKKRKFDKTEADTGFTPLPAGKYYLKIDKTDYRENAAKTGNFLEVTFTVDGKKGNGRKVWEYFNLNHESVQAEDIAWKQYKGMILACGMKDFPADTKELHGKVVQANLVIEEQKGRSPRNVIGSYIPAGKKKGKKGKKDSKPPWK